MSRLENVPFDDEEDADHAEEQWECAYPGECLMPSMVHHRSECFTVEDAEFYDAEMANEAS